MTLPINQRSRILTSVVILLAMTLLASSASAELTPKQAEQLRAKIRAALFIPNPLPDLDVKSYGSFSPTPDVVIEKVTYATEYGMRVPADIFRPAHSTGRLPAIVMIDGHGADKSTWYTWYTGILYARAGAIVLSYDPVGEGERNDDHKDGTSEHDREIDVPTMPARMGGLMLTDAMQAVSYLLQRKDVAPHRVAVLGFSMGSFIASIDGAADPRIHAMLLTGGGDLDGPGGYWDSSHDVMCQSGPYHALAFLGDRGAMIFALRALSGPTMIINGSSDTVVDIPDHGPEFFAELRQRAITARGSSTNAFETIFLPGVSHRPNWIMKPAAEWLDHQLHFANWHGKTLIARPTVDIGTWAAQVGLHLNRSSMRLDRDAGIPALAADVPLLTPNQLDVLPLAAWESQKAQFVYSAWVQHALTDARR